MKKLLIGCLALFTIAACKKEAPKDYVTLSGKVENKNSDSLFIYQGRNFSKTIKVNDDGTFSDTLKVASGMYGLYDGKSGGNLFLKNGFDLKMDVVNSEEGAIFKFDGTGAKDNKYLVEKRDLQEELFTPDMFDLDEETFTSKVGSVKKEFNDFLDSQIGLDSMLMADEKSGLAQLEKGMMQSYKQQKARTTQFASFVGKPSPAFENYENYKGGTTSLSDLKGKYVYVDIWATWCGPCKKEIPSLKKIEKEFHGKNIEFVSISVDDGRGFKAATKEASFAAAKEGWKKMIADKELGGVQLFSDKAWQSDFVTGFNIRGIPRFILIDPNGNVVNADAPRPSSPKLKELFNSLENI